MTQFELRSRKDGKEASPKDNRTPQARAGQGMDRKTATKNAVRYTQHTSEFSKTIATAEKLQERKSREECPYSSTRQPESECKIHKEDYIFCTSPSTAHIHLIIII